MLVPAYGVGDHRHSHDWDLYEANSSALRCPTPRRRRPTPSTTQTGRTQVGPIPRGPGSHLRRSARNCRDPLVLLVARRTCGRPQVSARGCGRGRCAKVGRRSAPLGGRGQEHRVGGRSGGDGRLLATNARNRHRPGVAAADQRVRPPAQSDAPLGTGAGQGWRGRSRRWWPRRVQVVVERDDDVVPVRSAALGIGVE